MRRDQRDRGQRAMQPGGEESADERAKRRVRMAAAALVVFVLADVVFALASRPPPMESPEAPVDIGFLLVVAAFPIVGLLILSQQPRNRVGWMLMIIGFAWVVPIAELGAFAMSRGITGGAVAAALGAGLWAPPVGLMGTVLLLRFPTGVLLSPRWRKVEVFAIATIVAIWLAIAVLPGDFKDLGYPDVDNPLGIDALEPVITTGLPAVLLCLPVAMLLSAVSLILRFQRSRGVERAQMKWLTTAAALLAAVYLFGMIASVPTIFGGTQPAWVDVLDQAVGLMFAIIPIAIGVAVLRYRLYDIDVVINKAIVYGALALFVTAAYVGIVVGVGRVIGTDRSLALQIAATVLVAVAFQPLRERVQRFANRLVYGRRATPYQVLAGFTEQIAGTYATDEIGSAVASLLVEGTGARRAEIWLRGEGAPRLEATWPAEDHPDPSAMPEDDELTRVVRVEHRGETLGDLVLRKAPNDPIGPGDEKLLQDVAAQAGLVLRNVRLIEDLRASRQRLVAARDGERRKLERNIHDGAQQRLVALAVLYNMAAGLAQPLGEEHRAAIADLGRQSQVVLETLRDLARGIYPAVLSDGGLVPALETQTRKVTLPVEIVPEGIGRYEQDVEAAVYFCCVEALQNVAKYARATRAVVRLEDVEGEVRFSVEDDGVGFDTDAVERGSGLQNFEDRLAARGGSFEVRSAPGSGTTVAGRVPAHRQALSWSPPSG